MVLTALGTIVGGAAWYLCQKFIPKFTASALVEVSQPGRDNPTTIEQRLANKDTAYQFRVSMAALMRQESLFRDLLQLDAIRETNWYQQFRSPDPEAVIELKENIFSVSPDRESQYIRASLTTSNPQESADILNELVSLFVEDRQGTSRDEIASKLSTLRTQESSLQRELDAAIRGLDQIRRATQITGLAGIVDGGDEFQHVIDLKERQLELQIDNLEADISELESNVETEKKRAESTEISVVTREQAETDPTYSSLNQRVSLLEASLEEMLTTLGENHRDVRRMRELVRQTKQERDARYQLIANQRRQANYERVRDQLAHLQRRRAEIAEKLAEAQRQKAALDEARAQYEAQWRKRNDIEDRLKNVQQTIQTYQLLLDDPETPKVKIAARALKPLRPSFPNMLIFVPAGFVLGGMLGVGLAFLVELLNDKVRTPRDAMQLSAPLLGVVYHSDDDKEVRKLDPAKVLREAPYSLTAECYRRFRTDLKRRIAGQKVNSLLITSPSQGDGRTTMAANLAMAIAAEAKKVLYVDANFRRPTSMVLFPKGSANMPESTAGIKGLSNFLNGQCQLNEAIRTTNDENLDVIDPGPMPNTPAELLGSARMNELLGKGGNGYDLIIIDGPPLLVSDARVLAAMVDGTVMLLNATKTKKGAAIRLLRELRSINVNVVGTVITCAETMTGGYFKETIRSYRNYQKVIPASV